LRNGLFLVLVHVLVLVLERPSVKGFFLRERFGRQGIHLAGYTAQTLEQEQNDREAGHALIPSSKYYMERSVLLTAESSTRRSRSTSTKGQPIFATGSGYERSVPTGRR
jgi:hypothetical protein